MSPLGNFPKLLIFLGIALICLGLILWAFPKMSFFGRLPGDINIKGGNWSFHFPIITCILISILISFLINFFSKK
ncbi:MAG: DUF2905 domain-containing protein [Nitrospinota bacterium]|nr:DUF2905 domain-containing protein [Nitrospinota bacterium]